METDQLSPNNPLYFTPDPEPSTAKPKINPKIFLFGGLLIVGLILLILSTIITQNKKPSIITAIPTSIPQVTPKNTIPPSINVPTQYQQPLNQIDTEIKTQLQFAPPEIDQEIGR